MLNKLDMVPEDERKKRVKDFIKRYRVEGPGVRDLGTDPRRLRRTDLRDLITICAESDASGRRSGSLAADAGSGDEAAAAPRPALEDQSNHRPARCRAGLATPRSIAHHAFRHRKCEAPGRQSRLDPRHQRRHAVSTTPRSHAGRSRSRTCAQLGKEVVLVSSGAIAEGMQRLGLTQRPTDIHELQACAAVGQMGLAQIYETSFRAHGLRTAQILLTHADLADRERYLNARSTLVHATASGRRSDHQRERHRRHRRDQVWRQRHARRAGGEPDRRRRARSSSPTSAAFITRRPAQGSRRRASSSEAQAGDPALEAMAGGAGTGIGRGGMLTKILAAKRAATSGAHTVIAWGRESDVLTRLAAAR